MAFCVLDCPHCGAREVAFRLIGAVTPPESLQIAERKKFAVAGAFCPRCAMPVALKMAATDNLSNTTIAIADAISKWQRSNGEPLPEEFHLAATIVPTPDGDASVPNYLPETVSRAFRQAELNFKSENAEEAAAIMYRRALELAVKDQFPELTGTLAARIKKLVDSGDLPKALGEWASEVRLVGNDGAHEVDGVTRPDLVDARGFTDAFLRYLVTMPEEVRRRRHPDQS